MRAVGFSTGALFAESPAESISVSLAMGADAIELSALRIGELDSVAQAVEDSRLRFFRWVSIHAPSRISESEESSVASLLNRISGGVRSVVVHPDTIHDFEVWRSLGSCLLLENMDRRKATGRYAADFMPLLRSLPAAGVCLDIAHARQIDPSLTEAFTFVEQYYGRIAELHISGINYSSRHTRVSPSAAYQISSFARFLPVSIPAIIESVIPEGSWRGEIAAVRELFLGGDQRTAAR